MMSMSLHVNQAGIMRLPRNSLLSSRAKANYCSVSNSGMNCCPLAGLSVYRALLLQAGSITHTSYVTRSQRAARNGSSSHGVGTQKFQGVYKHVRGRYYVKVMVDGVRRGFGLFDSQEEAARHRDMLLINFFGTNGTLSKPLPYIKFNYPRSGYKPEDVMKLTSLEQYRKMWAAKEASRPARKTSKMSSFEGVYPAKKDGTWIARVRIPGKWVYAGQYSTEEEAARAYDEMAYRLLGDQAMLDFPQDRERYRAVVAAGSAPVKEKKKSSRYLGVSFHRASGLWQARVSFERRHAYMYYDTEEEAARACDQAVMRLLPEDMWESKLNFPQVIHQRSEPTQQ